MITIQEFSNCIDSKLLKPCFDGTVLGTTDRLKVLH